MKKILFGITNLEIGGAEKVLVDIVNKLDKIYDITILTLYPDGELEKKLSSKVKFNSIFEKKYIDMTKLEKIKVSFNLLFRKTYLYNKYVKKDYDTEIAFLEGPITRLFSVKNKLVRKIVWIHNDISKVFGNNIKSKIKIYLDKKLYNKYEKLVFVSQDNLDKFKKQCSKIDISKLELIYNYIDKERILKDAKEKIDIEFNKETLNILSISRLVEQKAIDRLIKVHKRLIDNGFKHNIYVIGEGPEQAKLEKIIKDLKVVDTFKLLGKKQNPYPYLKKCDMLVLLSYYEGYGIVIEEAKIMDKFIAITNTAAREAVKDYNSSIIFENDEEKIYEGLKEIISNKDNYINDVKNSKNSYNNEAILEQIKDLLGE